VEPLFDKIGGRATGQGPISAKTAGLNVIEHPVRFDPRMMPSP